MTRKQHYGMTAAASNLIKAGTSITLCLSLWLRPVLSIYTKQMKERTS
jgi:hypothetical protein